MTNATPVPVRFPAIKERIAKNDWKSALYAFTLANRFHFLHGVEVDGVVHRYDDERTGIADMKARIDGSVRLMPGLLDAIYDDEFMPVIEKHWEFVRNEATGYVVVRRKVS